LLIGAICEFIGPLIFGTAVAKTIGTGIVEPSAIDIWVITSGLLGAITWNLITWWFGIPSSSSHALIGGIAGAVLAGTGLSKVKLTGFLKIISVLIISPLIGYIFGFLSLKISLFLVRGQGPSVNKFFKVTQLFSSMGLALSHGGNDAQKTMGIITMLLVSYKYLDSFIVPLWVVILCSFAIALGTATGGWSIIKTVGSGIYPLKPIHAFSTQTSSALVILTSALLGFPVSTSHIVSSTVMGVGSAERIKAVRWHKAGEIVFTWFITIPASGTTAAIIFFIILSIRHIL